MRKQRQNTTFSLSFLDIMCCGFGAVVLLVMILNGQTLQQREETQQDLRAELERAQQLREFARTDLEELSRQVEESRIKEGDLWAQSEVIRRIVSAKKDKNELAEEEAEQQGDEIEALEKEIASLERLKQRHKAREDQISLASKKIGFDGDGRRQYLTGLKLGGERTLILVDASASMLDETVVNIIRRKLMSASIRRQSPKWLRVVRSLHWVVSNLTAEKKFQVYYFNTEAHPAVDGTDRRWLDTDNPQDLKAAISAVKGLAPIGGTNLESALMVINQMRPKPDSVVLLTDGLPTRRSSRKVPHTVTGKERMSLFKKAAQKVPDGVPVNTLLFPMEGDPEAAVSFWQLAIDTRGSFITPSKDWP